MAKQEQSNSFTTWHIQPDLAMAIGETECYMLLHIHSKIVWYKAETQTIDGRYWYWHSTRKWAEELKIRTERTIQTALKNLKDLGFITVGNYNKHKYDKTLWYTINYEVLSAWIYLWFKQHSVGGSIPSSLIGLYRIFCRQFQEDYEKITEWETQISGFKLDTLLQSISQWKLSSISQPIQLIKELIKQSKEKEANADALQEQQTTGQKEETGGDPLSLPESKAKEIPPAPLTRSPEMVVTKNSADILADMKQKRLAKLSTDPVKVTPTAMGLIWKVELAELEGVTMVKNLTQPELGQMKSIINVLGTEHACPVIRCVLRNWVRFTKKASAAAGLKTTPDLPHIGFLLKYVTHAHALWVELGGQEPSGLLQSTATDKPVKRGKVTIVKNTVTKGPNLTQPSASKPATPNIHTPVVPPSDSGAAGSASEDDELVTLDVLSQFDE